MRNPTATFRSHGKYTPIVQPEDEERPLTGFVKGREASDLEERLYRAAVKHPQTRGIQFRRVFGAPMRSMFGATELDFLFDVGNTLAVQVDAERFHQSAAAIQRDNQQDVLLLKHLRRYGVSHINHVQGRHMATQDKADDTYDQLVSGRKFTKFD